MPNPTCNNRVIAVRAHSTAQSLVLVGAVFMAFALLPDHALGQTRQGAILTPARAIDLSEGSKGARRPVFSPDGRSLAACVWDTVYIWDTATGKLRSTLKGSGKGICSGICFRADGETLLTAREDSAWIRLWNVGDRTVSREFKAHATGSTGIASSGDLLASTDAEHTIKLWDLRKGVELTLVLLKKGEWFEHIAFSHDGKTIAIGGGAVESPPWGEIRVLDVPSLRTRFTLRGLGHAVTKYGLFSR
jgi:WD40 repeat protein